MAECKTCGKYFHACGSCGITEQWEWEYCSGICRDRKFSELAQQKADELHLSVDTVMDIMQLVRDNYL